MSDGWGYDNVDVYYTTTLFVSQLLFKRSADYDNIVLQFTHMITLKAVRVFSLMSGLSAKWSQSWANIVMNGLLPLACDCVIVWSLWRALLKITSWTFCCDLNQNTLWPEYTDRAPNSWQQSEKCSQRYSQMFSRKQDVCRGFRLQRLHEVRWYSSLSSTPTHKFNRNNLQ